MRRRGFLIGYAIGIGPVSSDPCSDCWRHPGDVLQFGHALHLGWTVGGRVALMVEAGGLGTDTADHSFVVAAAQWWPNPVGRGWVKGGFGLGSYVLGDVSNAASAPTYATALGEGGVEVVRSGSLTLDLQARLVATKRPDRWGSSFAASLGINWY